MKNILISTLLSLTLAMPALSNTMNGRDVIVTMNDVSIKSLNPSTREIQVTLTQPTINYKVEFDKFGMTPLTPTRFATLWAQNNVKKTSFATDHPNATLSFWDESGDFFEMDFAIQDVKTTSEGLVMRAQFIGNTQPIHMTARNSRNNATFALAQLNQKIQGGKNSVVMLIDRSPFDPWRRHHNY